MSIQFTQDEIKHIAQLAQIPVSDVEAGTLAHDFDATLKTIANLQMVNITNVPATHQVTGLENVWREDEVDTKTMFTQNEALSNAAESADGFFVVEQIIDQDSEG